MLYKSFPDGKELWRTAGRVWNTRRDVALLELGSHAFEITFEYEGGTLCHALDLATGREAAVVPVPGWRDESRLPAIAIAGGLLYGTDLGLVRLIPVAMDAHGPINGAADMAHAEPFEVNPATGPMVIDGHLDDWKDVEAHELIDPRDARSGGGAPTPTRMHGDLRLCYDGEGVYAAVRVDDPDHHSLRPGACALAGDNVRIAIDPLAAPWHQSGQVVLDAAVIDGVTKLWVNGSHDLPGAERASVRAAIDEGGMTYEFFVPWGYLRGDGSKRPGDLRMMSLGVLITKSQPDDSPRGLELGLGAGRHLGSGRLVADLLPHPGRPDPGRNRLHALRWPRRVGPSGSDPRQDRQGGAVDRRLPAQELHPPGRGAELGSQEQAAGRQGVA